MDDLTDGNHTIAMVDFQHALPSHMGEFPDSPTNLPSLG